MDQTRKERIAANEVKARDLNEKFGLGTFICECADLGCAGTVRMPRELYDAVRSDPMLFFALPGHEVPEAEDVVKRHEDFVVLRKHDDVKHIAVETDPRARLADLSAAMEDTRRRQEDVQRRQDALLDQLGRLSDAMDRQRPD
jgi:hypothetical protein